MADSSTTERNLVRVLEDPGEQLKMFCDLLTHAVSVRIVVGYVRRPGLELLTERSPRFLELLKRRAGTVLVGSEKGQLTLDAFRWFVENDVPHAIRVVDPKRLRTNGILHAKAWLLEPNPLYLWSFIGSTNLTKQGLLENLELAIWTPTPKTSTFAKEILGWYEKLLAASEAPDERALEAELLLATAAAPEDLLAEPPCVEGPALGGPEASPAPAAENPPAPAVLAYEDAYEEAPVAPSPETRAEAPPPPIPAASTEAARPGPPPTRSAPPPPRAPHKALAVADDVLFQLNNGERRDLLARIGEEGLGRTNLDQLNRLLMAGMRSGAIDVRDVVRVIPVSILKEIVWLHDAPIKEQRAAGFRIDLAHYIERGLGRRPTQYGSEIEVVRLPQDHSDPPGVIRIDESDPAHQLAPHQSEALEKLNALVVDPDDGMIVSLPTGAGKTRVGLAWALRNYVARGKRVLWLSHVEELLEQVWDALGENAGDARRDPSVPASFTASGWYGACEKDRRSLAGDVVIASVQSLQGKSMSDFEAHGRPRIDAIVIDEAHHVPAPTWKSLLGSLRPVRRVGLSATPSRTVADEERTLARYFNKGAWGHHLEKLLRDQGYLAELVHARVAYEKVWALSQQDVAHIEQFHEFSPALLRELARDDARANAIVREYMRIRERGGCRTLLFAIDIDHARALEVRLRNKGVSVATLVSEGTSTEDRREVLRRFRAGLIEVLCNVRIAAEGLDVPGVNTVFITRPTMSHTLYRQMIGRGLRGEMFGGTAKCLVVDLVDNFGRFNEKMVSSVHLGSAV